MGIAIENRLSDAGYRMLGDDSSIEELVQAILNTENIRYLKAIPYLLYKYDIDISKIREKTNKKELFNTILDITARILSELHIRKKTFRSERFDEALEGLYAKKYAINYDEFKDEFELQLRNNRSNLLIDTQKTDEERNLQYGLSQLFTKKEKYIIRRLQEEKPISKTDYEYYSRKTRKKLRSIILLEEFAKNIYPKMPDFDEDIFTMKRLLENWLRNEWKIEGSIQEFHLSNKRIIISLKDKNDELSTNIWNLNKMKNKELRSYLDKYDHYDFQ